MRAFITGVSGFVGQHLATLLVEQGAEVHGFDFRGSSTPRSAPNYNETVHPGGLLDATALIRVLEQVQPTHIFHLAGVLGGAPGGSAIQYEVNVLGTVRLFDALYELGQSPTVLIASSSAIYGAPAHQPIDEQQPYQPLTPYAASKAAQEMVGLQGFLSRGLPVLIVRSFNLVGPGQSPALVTSELARQIAQAEQGAHSSVRVGNLTPRRDYTDVRDAVRAYVLLASGAQPGQAYNVCSSHSRSVQECADILMALARVRIAMEIDPARVRTVEIQDQVGDPTRIYQATGWQPEISLETSLQDLLNDWRQRIAVHKEDL